MADGSWDNGGHGVPVKTGMPLWGKIALGCGIAFLVVLVTCVGGVAYLGNRIKKDPEGFKNKVMGFALEQVRPDWEDFRAVVEHLRSPEGCQALYAANPGLAKTWPSEAAFLEASSRWHKEVVTAPDLTPDLMERQGLQINHDFGGKVTVGWSPKSGRAVYVTFEKARKAGDTGPRRVVELDVR
ncbi:MAG: hypothetical protein WAS25_08980 [Geothrix sp.]|uniref:hypothetical protein n=1 Tax=Geothrix sp. TaxID=1962974 RepID=UPI003BAED0ED